MQVHEVAEHVQRGDLAAAVGQDLVAGGEAFQHEAALGGAFALVDDVLVGIDVPNPDDGRLDNPSLLSRQRPALLKLADQGLQHSVFRRSPRQSARRGEWPLLAPRNRSGIQLC